MNKFIIFLVVVAVAIAGWFAISGLSNDYEVVVVDEVTQLEEELAVLDEAVANGTLTVAQAVEARGRISTSLAKITANASGTGDVNLTAAQRAQLQDGLQRLKDVLIKYQSTLVAIDTEAAKETKRSGGSGGGKTLVSQFIDVVDSVEDVVAEVVDDYVVDESAEGTIDEIDAETSDTIDEIISEIDDEEASSTDTQTEVEGEATVEGDAMVVPGDSSETEEVSDTEVVEVVE